MRLHGAGRLAAIAVAAVLLSPAAPGAEQGPVPVRKIDTQGFGTWCGFRMGDLDGDGRRDFLLARRGEDQNVTCLTALDLTGRKLWQKGRPGRSDYRTSFDLPVQIYDIDGDGRNEAVSVAGGRLEIRSGRTGEIEKTAELPDREANDCIVFADFAGRGQPRNVVVKTRYEQVWALDENLEVMWTWKGNTGHYPWPHDFDGDGRDELMCGYRLLDDDGEELWQADLPGHSDGVAVADIDADDSNGAEIGQACCGGATFAVLGRDGSLRWKHECGHSQHVVFGDFRPDLAGLEVACLDRGRDRSPRGVDAIVLYSHDGKRLWREERTDSGRNRWLTVLTTVRHWEGRERDLILAYRRGGSTPPTLYDGRGREVARFPFPRPERQHFAQHADLLGDGREEIVVWDEERIYIYRNGASCADPPPKQPRPAKMLYNYTHYIGTP